MSGDISNMKKFTESDDSGKISRCWKKAKLVKYGELLTKAKRYASAKLPNGSKTSSDSCETSAKMDDTIDNHYSTNLTSSTKDLPTKFPRMKIENQAMTQVTMPSLQEHPAYYLLTIKLIEGTDLLVKDACGTSDPFVTFSYKGELLYKSKIILRSLNPLWNEEFYLILEGPFAPSSYLKVEVYDYDRFMTDDFMGSAFLNMGHYRALTQSGSVQSRIPLEIPEDVGLYAGYLTIELNMKEIGEVERAQMSKRTKDSSLIVKKTPNESQWNFIVDLVLVEAKILQIQSLDPLNTIDQDQEADFYVKFILGTQKFKSKVCRCSRNQHPKWGQRFSSKVSEDCGSLTVKLCNRCISSRVVGECSINLKLLPADKTHKKWFELENGVGKVFLTLSLSAANTTFPSGSSTTGDVRDFGASSPEEIIILLYSQPLPRGFVGRLLVTVYKAENLAAADLGGKSDPFCVLELVNQRVKTKSVYKTLEPEWNKTFLFDVEDINANMEISVFDEDKESHDFLGKIIIPLLEVIFSKECEIVAMQSGQSEWFILKDKNLETKSKGRILLRFDLKWNPIKAALRTFEPAECKYVRPSVKFQKAIFMRLVDRLKKIIDSIISSVNFTKSCFTWEYPFRSIAAFLIFIIITWTVELWMLPLVLLLTIVGQSLIRGTFTTTLHCSTPNYHDEKSAKVDASLENDKNEEKSKSLKEKWASIQETMAQVQAGMQFTVDLMDRFKNSGNFTRPFLTWLAVVCLTVATLVFYFVPLRWLILAWGVNKFTKKFRKPKDYVDNNELLDFLSRVPCEEELRKYGRLKDDNES